jgi:hypothetical protein
MRILMKLVVDFGVKTMSYETGKHASMYNTAPLVRKCASVQQFF